MRPETAAAKGNPVEPPEETRAEPEIEGMPWPVKKKGKFIDTMRAIRGYCFVLAGWSYKAVAERVGEFEGMAMCPLYPFRFGVRPATAKKRGKKISV